VVRKENSMANPAHYDPQGIHPDKTVPVSPAESLSFERAVSLFKSWGFVVEPGPQPDEVSLIIRTPDHQNTSVYPAAMLPEIAAVALRVRQRRAMARQIQQVVRLAELYPSRTLAS